MQQTANESALEFKPKTSNTSIHSGQNTFKLMFAEENLTKPMLQRHFNVDIKDRFTVSLWEI